MRLHRLLAQLERLVDEDRDLTMAEALACKYPECGRTRASTDTHFCLQHAYATNAQAARLVVETTNYLDLEAQFDAYCIEHGLPDPHEK